MPDWPVAPERTALINVDLQNFFVENAPDGFGVLERVNRVSEACRSAGILVIHTAHVIRPDGSNAGVLGELIPEVLSEGFLNEGDPTAALNDGLVVERGDVLLQKPRFGAFYGTELEGLLRDRGIDTVVISGISTDVCCDTTAREANARDFRVLFLRDATAVNAESPEEAASLQAVTLNLIDGLFGQVLTIDELLAKIAEGARVASAG
jgi:nicotinamidase-related amidase